MTDKQKQVLARARATKARFIEADPSRITRFTAYYKFINRRDAEMKRKASECLEAELQRLVKTWSK